MPHKKPNENITSREPDVFWFGSSGRSKGKIKDAAGVQVLKCFIKKILGGVRGLNDNGKSIIKIIYFLKFLKSVILIELGW